MVNERSFITSGMNEAAVLKRPLAQAAPTTCHALREVVLLGEEVTYRALPGRGEPILAIHGLGSDGRDLLDLCERIGHPTVLVDLPGFGFSARPERAYSVRRAAEICLALLNHLGWVRPIWLGASYGAHVTLRAALDSPSRVERLVLLSAGGLDPNPPAALREHFREERLAARSRQELAATLAILAKRITPATEAYAARRLALHGARVAPGKSDLRAVARSATGALCDDAPRRLEEIFQPTELVHGTSDPLVAMPVVEAAAKRLPRGRLRPLSGLGHLPWLESPAEVAAHLRRVLEPSV